MTGEPIADAQHVEELTKRADAMAQALQQMLAPGWSASQRKISALALRDYLELRGQHE